MSKGMDNPFPRLKTASTKDVEIYCKEYKSGATYQGPVENHRKVGRGTFIWPNGSKYEGEFLDNARHGKGKRHEYLNSSQHFFCTVDKFCDII